MQEFVAYVRSVPVFEALYLLVTFGHDDPQQAHRLDPPTDYFRIRYVSICVCVCVCQRIARQCITLHPLVYPALLSEGVFSSHARRPVLIEVWLCSSLWRCLYMCVLAYLCR